MKPTVKEKGIIGGSEVSHPAFGSITVHRSQGGSQALHGSDFLHQRFISIEINTATINRQDSYDHHHARNTIVKVMLSEAQWATFVSSMGQGSGTPCTLSWVKGEGRIPEIEMDSQTEHLRSKALERVDGLLGPIIEFEKLLQDSKMQVGVRKTLENQIKRLKQELKSNMPYFLENFEKHMETTIEKAKIEVHAYINSEIQKAGLTALHGDDVLKVE